MQSEHMNTVVDEAAAVISTPTSASSNNRSRFTRWGGLLAALACTDDFDSACRDDADIKQMVNVVQRLEASFQDCAVRGPQKMVEAFIACELTPAILNRWNSPVLDGLWQAVTGRTPDGVTPFGLNPPDTAAELLNRLVFPRAYSEAVDLFLELTHASIGSTAPYLVLAPAIVTCASAGHFDILKRLLLYPLDQVAQDYVRTRLSRIAACGHLSCCEIVFPLLVASGSVISTPTHPVAVALRRRTSAGQFKMVKFLLSYYEFTLPWIEDAVLIAAALPSSLSSDATFELLYNSLQTRSPDFLSEVLQEAASCNSVRRVQCVLEHGVLASACSSAAAVAMRRSDNGTEVLALLLARLSMRERLDLLLHDTRVAKEPFSFNVVCALLESLRDLPRPDVQRILDQCLFKAMMGVQVDQIALLLQHGAHARAVDDHIIYLAAVSGRADVMELLLGATDVDAQCAARYRQQMNESGGLLGMAQHLHQHKSAEWLRHGSDFLELQDRSSELWSALIGGSVPALEWLATLSMPRVLDFRWPLLQAVRAGDVAVVRTLLDARHSTAVQSDQIRWRLGVAKALQAAQEMRHDQIVQLLLHLSFETYRVTLSRIRGAIQANDPFTLRYLLEYFKRDCSNSIVNGNWQYAGLPTLLDACSTGHLALTEALWRFMRCAYKNTLGLEALDPRMDCALRLCVEGDLTPVMMVLLRICNDLSFFFPFHDADHPMVLAARCGHLPAVRLWLAQGIPAQWGLSAAVKHRQREVAACLIAHGASPSELSSTEQPLLQSVLVPP